jgi:16S rRNA processing protein RimM
VSDGDRPSLIAVGRVGRPHGRDGSFVVEEASEAPERFAVGATVRVDGSPAEVVASKRAGSKPVVKLSVVAPRGARLEVERVTLPALGEGSYYVFDLIGLEALDEEGTSLGRVADILERPANDVIELDSGTLLPLVKACVLEVDLEAGRLVIARNFGLGG